MTLRRRPLSDPKSTTKKSDLHPVRPPTLHEVDQAWHAFAALAKQDPIFWRALVLKLDARFEELARRKDELNQ